MRQAGVTVAPVYTIADAFADAHFRERGIVVEARDPELGQLPMQRATAVAHSRSMAAARAWGSKRMPCSPKRGSMRTQSVS